MEWMDDLLENLIFSTDVNNAIRFKNVNGTMINVEIIYKTICINLYSYPDKK